LTNRLLYIVAVFLVIVLLLPPAYAYADELRFSMSFTVIIIAGSFTFILVAGASKLTQKVDEKKIKIASKKTFFDEPTRHGLIPLLKW